MGPRDIALSILAGDLTVIPGNSAVERCGWLTHPEELATTVSTVESIVRPRHARTVLIGMGGSASGAGMLLEANGVDSVQILDTSFPDAVQSTSFESVNVIASSKSGGTIETVCALAYALNQGLEPRDLIIITDEGTSLHELGLSIGATVILGDRKTGGRFSALSVFGLAPAVVAGLSVRDLEVWPTSPDMWCDAFVRGFESVSSTRDVNTSTLRDDPLTSWAALWEEQLIAESTGKAGKGVFPLAGSRNSGESVQETHARVIGMCVRLGVDPFDQPDVEQSKLMTFEILRNGFESNTPERESIDQCVSFANDGVHPIAIQVFCQQDSQVASALTGTRDRFLRNGRVALAGMGPRYLHSTGQLFKGGPAQISLLQIAVKPQSEPIRIPGRAYSFHDLLNAQWRGDRRAMQHLGRDVRSIECDTLQDLVVLLAQLG